MFPNPNEGEFTISFDSSVNTNDKVEVSIYDISGRLVYENRFINNTRQFYETIKLNNAMPGVYLAIISNGDSSTTHKIVLK